MKHAPAIIILVIHFLIFAIVNQFLNPHPDMLDHWVWSRYLSLSYYEHPPMIAWLIRGITLIGGNTETALEVGSQLLTISIIALTYAGTFRLYGTKAALVTLLILCSMPYFTLGSIFLHITQPFLIFWVAAHQVAERVRLGILEKLPAVNEVLVHVDAEDDFFGEDGSELPQDIVLMRPQSEIENDVKKMLTEIPEIQGITHIYCHYLNQKLTVQVNILLDAEMRIRDAQKIASAARRKIEQISDIDSADLHLELDDTL